MAARRVRRWLWVGLQVPCLLAFIGYRIGAAVAYPPAVWQDSEGYKAVAASGWFSTKLWVGARAPLTPVLMKLTGSYHGYAVLQGILGASAWAFLAYTVSRLVGNSWRKPLVTVLVLGFAASPLVVMWDGSALSESPSLSVLALLCASFIWLIRRFTRLRLLLVGVAVLLYCGLRDADIYTFAIVGVVLLVVGIIRTLQGAAAVEGRARATIRANWQHTRQLVMVASILVVLALATGAAARSAHRSPRLEDALAVRIFPFPDRVAWFAGQGMPQETNIDALAVEIGAAPGAAKVVEPDLTQPQWAPLARWITGQGQTTYDLYLFLHPWYVLSAPFASPPLTFNDGSGNLAYYVPSGFPMATWLGDLFNPNRAVELALAFVALVVAGARAVAGRREWQFMVVFGVIGLWSMLLAWHGEGMEATRHTVEGDVAARLAVLLSLLLAVLVTRPTRRPSPEPEGQVSAAPLARIAPAPARLPAEEDRRVLTPT